jgi:hypothetical protein
MQNRTLGKNLQVSALEATTFANGDFRNTVPRFTDVAVRRTNRAFVDDLREIEEAQIEAQGARYSEANQRMIDR